MEKALAVYRRWLDVLFKIVVTFSALIIGLDVLSIFLEAVGRYAFGQSRAFMEELPRLMIPFVVFPMMGVLLKLNKHVTVDVLPEKMKGKTKSLLLVAVYAVVVTVAAVFFIAGVVAVKYYHAMGFETETEIIFKLWVTYLPFPLGFALLILFCVELLWAELLTLWKLCWRGYS